MYKRITITLIFLLLSSISFANDDCSEFKFFGTPEVSDYLLCRKGYLLSYNTKTKNPDWVIEHLTKYKLQSNIAKRSDNFQPDPSIKIGERAELSDYKNSGFDRGHMAPAADMKWDNIAMAESFYLSNMAPQVGIGMNRGIWKVLEDKVRDTTFTYEELYVITGPMYMDNTAKTIGNGVRVPSHFFKIAYSPKSKEAIAFIMPNIALKTSQMKNYIVTIADVEQLTGFDFFNLLDDQIENEIQFDKSLNIWK